MNEWVNETFLAALEPYIFLLWVGGEYSSLFPFMPSRTLTRFPQLIYMVFTGAFWKPPTPWFLNSAKLCLWNVSLSR